MSKTLAWCPSCKQNVRSYSHPGEYTLCGKRRVQLKEARIMEEPIW